MALNVLAIVSIVVFYTVILIAGVWAARVTRNRRSKQASDTMIVGGQDIGLCLGICTMTATWIGGGALNGTAETVYSPYLGLIWCAGAFSFGLSLVIAGLFFVKKMRQEKYLTALDPFQAKLGKYFAAFFFLIEGFGVVVYIAAILNALGGTIQVIAGLPRVASIILSAGIATSYTILGGIYSVAYTDIIQLAFMVLGLAIVIPFAITNEAVSSITDTFYSEQSWAGKWDPSIGGAYIDTCFLALFGGIPVQAAFQRLLAIDTTRNAQIVSMVGGLFAALLIIPPAIIGAIGASTNWTLTNYMEGNGTSPADLGDERLILPIVIQYLTPPAVSYFGLGVITAAVMSSADSCCLGIAGEFGRNVHHAVLRPNASQREVVWVIRGSIVMVGVASTVIAIQVKSIMTLYILSTDLIYVLTWPEFVGVLYFNTNAYGALLGIILGIILRIGGGEFLLDIPGPFNYVGGYNFPAKTVAMIITFLSTLLFSYVTKWMFSKGYIPARYDIFKSGLGKSNHLISRSMTDNSTRVQETDLNIPFVKQHNEHTVN